MDLSPENSSNIDIIKILESIHQRRKNALTFRQSLGTDIKNDDEGEPFLEVYKIRKPDNLTRSEILTDPESIQKLLHQSNEIREYILENGEFNDHHEDETADDMCLQYDQKDLIISADIENSSPYVKHDGTDFLIDISEKINGHYISFTLMFNHTFNLVLQFDIYSGEKRDASNTYEPHHQTFDEMTQEEYLIAQYLINEALDKVRNKVKPINRLDESEVPNAFKRAFEE